MCNQFFFCIFAPGKKHNDMKTTEPVIKLVLSPKSRKDGTSPIYIHVNWKTTRAAEASGVYATKSTFSLQKRKPKVLNRLREVEDRAYELLSSGKPFTAKDCLGKVSSVSPVKAVLEMASVKRLSKRTTESYFTAVKSVSKMFPDFMLDSLTLMDIKRWAKMAGLQPQTVCNYLKKLHSLYEYSLAAGYVKENPMKGWRFKADGYRFKDKPRAKTRTEVSMITDVFLAGGELSEAAGIWLAGYYFCGMALVDLVAQDWSSVKKVHSDGEYYSFTYRRRKTMELATVMTPVFPITEKLMALLLTRPWEKHKSYIQYVNRRLGKILPGLTYYQCRHTFAKYMVERGVPLNIVCGMMGRSVNGIAAYVTRVSEPEMMAEAASKIRFTEMPPSTEEDLW